MEREAAIGPFYAQKIAERNRKIVELEKESLLLRKRLDRIEKVF